MGLCSKCRHSLISWFSWLLLFSSVLLTFFSDLVFWSAYSCAATMSGICKRIASAGADPTLTRGPYWAAFGLTAKANHKLSVFLQSYQHSKLFRGIHAYIPLWSTFSIAHHPYDVGRSNLGLSIYQTDSSESTRGARDWTTTLWSVHNPLYLLRQPIVDIYTWLTLTEWSKAQFMLLHQICVIAPAWPKRGRVPYAEPWRATPQNFKYELHLVGKLTCNWVFVM